MRFIEKTHQNPTRTLALCPTYGLLFLLSVCCALSTSPACAQEDAINADRPGIADGSAVLGPRRFQIEFGAQYEKHRSGSTDTELLFLPALFRVGIDRHWELRIEGNTLTHSHTVPSADSEELAPLSLGFKYQWQTSEGRKRPSLGAIFRLFPSSGTGDLRTYHGTADLRLAADWDFAPNLSLNPNIGIAVYEDGEGRSYGAGLLACTLSYQAGKRLGFFVDGGLQTQEESGGKASLTLDAGATYLLSNNCQFDLSFGTGALGHSSPHPFVGAGISLRF